MFFARIDYQDREKRKDQKSLEVVWQGSKTFASLSQVRRISTIVNTYYDCQKYSLQPYYDILVSSNYSFLVQIFAGAFPVHYSAPPSFQYELNHDSFPIQVHLV